MKIKTKDKIAYITMRSGVKSSFWKNISKEDPLNFEKIFQKAKDGDTIKVSNGMVTVEPKLPIFETIDFSLLTLEEKYKHEVFIKKSSLELLHYIEEFNLVGACMTIPYFYKLFLEKYHIPINVEYGVFELHGRFSAHSWNKYDGKLVDLTANLQKEGVCGDAVVMENILRKGKDKFVYHRADHLPKSYLNCIEKAALEEKNLLSADGANNGLAYLKEMLDTDGRLCEALKVNMNSSETIKNQLLPKNSNEYKHFQDNFENKFLID
jgi:hypothetical protein